MRHALIGLFVMLATVAAPASAQVSFAYSAPGISIGINVPVYPVMQRIPNYPVYYAPALHANYFFYDGLYWVFDGYTWYESPWYDGPWHVVDPYAVPVYLLRVPVRYYRAPPVYFRSWSYDAPPRWGEHWGTTWTTRRAGWDRWDRRSMPAAAPLPTYQRSYTGSRYPRDFRQQAAIQTRSYSYQPRERFSRERFQERVRVAREAPATTTRGPQRNVENMQRQEQRFAQRAEERTGRAAQNMRRQEEHFARKQVEAQTRVDRQAQQRQQRAQQRVQQQERVAQHQAQQRQRQAERRQQQQERHAERREQQRERQARGPGGGRGHDKQG